MSKMDCPFCDHYVSYNENASRSCDTADELIATHIELVHPEKTEEDVQEAYLVAMEKEVEKYKKTIKGPCC